MPALARTVGLPLSPRMRACMRLVCRGYNNQAVGEALGISPHTAHGMIYIALRRLGTTDREEGAAIYARTLAGGGVTADADAALCLDVLAHTLDVIEAHLADVEARCAALRKALAYPRRVVAQRRRLAEEGPDAVA